MILNQSQQLAVNTLEGRILILAGAGSGKTGTIIHRIANMIANGIPPRSILGLTFTNKAAREMKNRLEKIVGANANFVELSTFHSFCVKILRKEIFRLGYTANFSIYDQKDVQRVIKEIAHEVLESAKSPSLTYTIKCVQNRDFQCTGGWHDNFVLEIKKRLAIMMKASNAVDFDGLIDLTIALFSTYPTVLEHYQDRYRYIMIDEYQDTDDAQFKVSQFLAKKYNNICVVGDDDQSIYSFRGANIQNILDFRADKIIKLEKNYRSSASILEAANKLIQHNVSRHKKKLVTTRKASCPIQVTQYEDAIDEAEAIVDKIKQLQRTTKLSDIAILYRSNILARPIETALMRCSWYNSENRAMQGIPYEIFGGTSFTERTEIKDIVAYLKVIYNPADRNALFRIINVPRRGVSTKTVDKICQRANETKRPLLDIIAAPQQLAITKRGERGLLEFHAIITETQKRLKNSKLSSVLEWFVEAINYKQAIKEEVKSDVVRQFKWENVLEFIASVKQLEKESATTDQILEQCITHAALNRSSLKASKDDKVQVMTFHSAKGLEFKICFLIGIEEEILPHIRSIEEGNTEEERRLFYVAITRAKDELFISFAKERKKHGITCFTSPSRFLDEIAIATSTKFSPF